MVTSGIHFGVIASSIRSLIDDILHKTLTYNYIGIRDADSDFDLDSDNTFPEGITAYNDNLWVVDRRNFKIYTYNPDGTRVSDFDFNLSTNNNSPRGITSYNDKFYVVDITGNKVFAYYETNIPLFINTTADFTLDSLNSRANGASISNDRLWVVDITDNKVYAYNMPDGSRDATNDFNLESTNIKPHGIASHGNKLYIINQSTDQVFVYNSPNGINNFAWESTFSLDSLHITPRGIAILNDKIYVPDGDTTVRKVFVYDLDGTRDASLDFNLDSSNRSPHRIGVFNNIFYINDRDDNKLYVYNADGTYNSSLDVDLSIGDPEGITSYLGRLYLIERGTGVFSSTTTNLGFVNDASFDFPLGTDNTAPSGITAYDDKFWIVDIGNLKVYVYNSDGTRDADSDFTLGTDNTVPDGITALNGYLCVTDALDHKVYTYNTDGTLTSPSLDFDLDSDNDRSTGITAYNNKLWVVDFSDEKLYVYNPKTFSQFGDDIQVNSTNNKIEFNGATGDDRITTTFDPLSDIKWYCDFTYEFTAISGTPAHFILYLSTNTDVPATDRTHIGIMHTNGNLVLHTYDDISGKQESTEISLVTPASLINTPLYGRLERVSPTQVKLQVFTDAEMTSTVSTNPEILTIDPSLGGLNTLIHGSQRGILVGNTLTASFSAPTTIYDGINPPTSS